MPPEMLPATKPLIRRAGSKSRFKFNRDNSSKVYAWDHQEVICHPSSSFHATSATYLVAVVVRLPAVSRKLKGAERGRAEHAGINFRNYRRVSANAYIIGHWSVPPSPPVVNARASVFESSRTVPAQTHFWTSLAVVPEKYSIQLFQRNSLQRNTI